MRDPPRTAVQNQQVMERGAAPFFRAEAGRGKRAPVSDDFVEKEGRRALPCPGPRPAALRQQGRMTGFPGAVRKKHRSVTFRAAGREWPRHPRLFPAIGGDFLPARGAAWRAKSARPEEKGPGNTGGPALPAGQGHKKAGPHDLVLSCGPAVHSQRKKIPAPRCPIRARPRCGRGCPPRAWGGNPGSRCRTCRGAGRGRAG